MNEKLTLQDLVDLLAQKTKVSKKEADLFLKELFSVVADTIYEGDSVKIKDFGTFKLTPVSKRESVNINTGEKIEIPAHFRLGFQPDKLLKELVNKPFASFESVLLDSVEETDVAVSAEKERQKFQDKVKEIEQADPELTDDDLDEVDEDVVDDIEEIDSEIIAEDSVQGEDDVLFEQEIIVSEPVVEEKKIDSVASQRPVEKQNREEVRPKQKSDANNLLNEIPTAIPISPLYEYSYTTTTSANSVDANIENLSLNNVEPKIGNDRFSAETVSESKASLPLLPVESSEDIVEPVDDSLSHDEYNDFESRGLVPDYNDKVVADIEDTVEESEIDYDKVPDFYNQKPSLGKRILKKIPIVIFALLLIGVIVYMFMGLFNVQYGYENFLRKPVSETDTVMPNRSGVAGSSDSLKDETALKIDSLRSELPGDIEEYKSARGVDIQNLNKAEDKFKSQNKPQVAPIASEVMKSGLTLRSLAAKYYGQSVYWVYIYEENKGLIEDPDNIPVGITVNIPNAEKYKIDSKNTASMSEAKKLEAEVIRDARQKRFARVGSN